MVSRSRKLTGWLPQSAGSPIAFTGRAVALVTGRAGPVGGAVGSAAAGRRRRPGSEIELETLVCSDNRDMRIKSRVIGDSADG